MKKLIIVCLLAITGVLNASAQSIIEADINREVNPVLNSIMTRTSVRKYTDEPISKVTMFAM